jgi:hypothetical protein
MRASLPEDGTEILRPSDGMTGLFAVTASGRILRAPKKEVGPWCFETPELGPVVQAGDAHCAADAFPYVLTPTALMGNVGPCKPD